MTNAIRGGLAAAVLALGFSLPSQSQAQMDVDVTIGINEIIILYAYTDLTVDIPAAALESILSPSGTCSGSIDCDQGADSATASFNAGSLEADFNLSSSLGTSPSNVPVVLQNVWAVRGISDNQLAVDVTLGDNTLSNGGSTITVNSVASSGSQVSGGFPAPGLGSEEVGDVSMDLDLSAVDAAGNHTAAGAVYTIEATSF